jgi:hypothetical protein
MRDILPALIARQIRILPIVVERQAKHVCIRLELYGCSYQGKSIIDRLNTHGLYWNALSSFRYVNSMFDEDGPMTYSIPQGDKRGYDVQFIDETYDGDNDNGILKRKLKSLVDFNNRQN